MTQSPLSGQVKTLPRPRGAFTAPDGPVEFPSANFPRVALGVGDSGLYDRNGLRAQNRRMSYYFRVVPDGDEWVCKRGLILERCDTEAMAVLIAEYELG